MSNSERVPANLDQATVHASHVASILHGFYLEVARYFPLRLDDRICVLVVHVLTSGCIDPWNAEG